MIERKPPKNVDFQKLFKFYINDYPIRLIRNKKKVS